METIPISSNFTFDKQSMREIFEVNIEKDTLKLFPRFELFMPGLLDNIEKYQAAKCLDNNPHQYKELLLDKKREYFQLSACSAALLSVIESYELKNLAIGVPNDKIAKELLVAKIETIIQQLCRSVLSFHGQQTSERFIYTKISKLPYLLKDEIETLEEKQLQLYKAQSLFNKQIEHYLECVISAIGLMRRLLECQKKSIKFSSSVAAFYCVKCEAISLKAKILEMQILTDTYTSETVPVCKKIEKQLLLRKSSMERDLTEKRTILQCYEAVGPCFDALVQEYSKLSAAIANEKWALEEWSKSKELM